MYCDHCGGVLMHEGVPGGTVRSYCRKCEPPKTVLLPINNPNLDVTLEDLGDLGDQGYIQTPVPDALGATYAGPPLTFDPAIPDDFTVITADGTNDMDWNLDIRADGVPILQVVEDLPEDAAQGAIAYIRGESAAYVYDGDEWHNLGQVARKISGRDAKCDRRAAVAATKRKGNG